jgi:hypothetical protein
MNDKEKIEELLHHFRMKATEFADKCGFEYHIVADIKREQHGISKKVFSKIVEAFPEVNKNWLATGEGEMIKINNEQKVGDINAPVTSSNINTFNQSSDFIEIIKMQQTQLNLQQENMNKSQLQIDKLIGNVANQNKKFYRENLIKCKIISAESEYTGYFHKWTNSRYDTEVTYGIVEEEDGSVNLVYPNEIKFINK